MSILDGIKILKDLDKNELQNLEVFCQERFLPTGELLFKEGDEVNAMYLLKEGEIEIFQNNSGEEIVLGKIEAEDIFGEMAIFGDNKKRMASARSTKNSVIIILLEFSIQELTKNHPDILNKIKEIIKTREEDNKKIFG